MGKENRENCISGKIPNTEAVLVLPDEREQEYGHGEFVVEA